MEKPEIREIIVVEGKDDTAALKRAVVCETIETHGFGMADSIWPRLEKARDRGIIIFTDPDRAGQNIRNKVSERFPEAKHAYLPKSQALKGNNVGVENARPEDIRSALEKAHGGKLQGVSTPVFTNQDLISAGLTGRPDSRKKREALGDLLGIGYANGKTMLERLNHYGISREEFHEAIRSIDHKDDQK